MDMGWSSDNSNWLFPYHLMDDMAVPGGGEFAGAATGFSWPPQPLNASPNASVEVECSFGDSDSLKEVGSNKRVEVDCLSGDSDSIIKEIGSRKRGIDFHRPRSESSGGSCSKACREKLRRDRLNERFLELVAVMEPGRLPKTDKAAILSDAARILTQLRGESRHLKDTIDDLQAKVKELKAEKIELRDERQRLKEEKERLEQQVRVIMTAQQSSFIPHSSSLTAQGQATSNKIMPFISYPGMTMWPVIPQATLDTSQDHVLRPPVA